MRQYDHKTLTDMQNKQDTDIPLSESSVSLNLEVIQRRCREHMGMGTTDDLELCLEEASAETITGDPYNDQSLSTTVNRRFRSGR